MRVAPALPDAPDAQEQDPVSAVRACELRMAYDLGRGATLPVLDGIDLAVAPGELVAVLGPSGCGKSTLLRILAGLQAPTAGAVEIDGQPPERARWARAIGLVLQEHALLPWRTALENVRLGLEIRTATVRERSRTFRGPLPRPEPAKDRGTDAAEEVLALVGLAEFAGYYPHQLSGGMRQRVSLARALALRPRLLLLDEPFAALDELTRGDLGQELLRLWSLSGATAILVTHSVAEAVALADRVAVLTARPARVVDVRPIDLPRPRPPDVDGTPEFAHHVGEIKRLLRDGRGLSP